MPSDYDGIHIGLDISRLRDASYAWKRKGARNLTEGQRKQNRTKAVEAAVEELNTGSGAPAANGRTLEQALGIQVRTVRRDLDLTVSDLASAAGISVGML